MKKRTPLSLLLSVLLAAATLLGPANSESPCAGIHGKDNSLSVRPGASIDNRAVPLYYIYLWCKARPAGASWLAPKQSV